MAKGRNGGREPMTTGLNEGTPPAATGDNWELQAHPFSRRKTAPLTARLPGGAVNRDRGLPLLALIRQRFYNVARNERLQALALAGAEPAPARVSAIRLQLLQIGVVLRHNTREPNCCSPTPVRFRESSAGVRRVGQR